MLFTLYSTIILFEFPAISFYLSILLCYSVECLQWLIQHADGDPYVTAKDGMSAIHAAAQAGQLDCLRWLVEEAGVPIRLRATDGATPAHFAAANGEVCCVYA